MKKLLKCNTEEIAGTSDGEIGEVIIVAIGVGSVE